MITKYPRLVLLAPRDHSKTTVGLVDVLWEFYRHATDPATGRPRTHPAGRFVVLLFSATAKQASVLMARFQELLAANAELFGTAPATAAAGARPVV